MDINVKRFVDINIQYHEASTNSSIRDTAVLYHNDTGTDGIYASLSEITLTGSFASTSNVYKYAKVFFDNGGIKLDIRKASTKEEVKADIANLSTKEIVIASCVKDFFNTMKSIAEEYTNDSTVYGVNQKIFLASTDTVADYSAINNFAVKVSKKIGDSEEDTTGCEMTIAAYLTKLQIYAVDSVKDYAFTVEDIYAEVNDDTLLGNALENNMNVDMTLANAIRNLGGNLTNGLDLVNQYVLIVLQQTVTDRLLSLLTQKLKGNAGLSAIYTTIVAELNKFITNGYLATDKTWTDATKTVTVNDTTYTLIEKGTSLNLGYHVTILPFTALTDEEKKQRKCPPIYIFLADSLGIRSITIQGEVI